MAVPGAGWSIVWGPEKDYAYLIGPDGAIMGRWFADNPGMSTFDPETTGGIIEEANAPAEAPAADTGGGVYGAEVISDPFWPGLAEYFTDAWEAQAAYSQWLEDMNAQEAADAQAAWEEQQAYWEQQEAEQLARQLAGQHASQEEAWAWAVAGAPAAGSEILDNLLPAYLPDIVAQHLREYGERMGAGYNPPWPGGTELNVAQIVPKGQDWVDYLVGLGYPGYLWER